MVFEVDADYKKYLLWLKEYSDKYHLAILGYCLMNNHVHFIVVPENEESLSRVFNTLHMRYAQYANYKKKMKGHLWQGRFYSCLLDETHLYCAIRYVERNPVRANIVKRAWKYKWSSARCRCGEEDESIINISKNFKISAEEWRKYLIGEDEEIAEEIRLKTQRGLAIGTNNFIKQMEEKIGRSLKCLNPGRPKRKRALSPF